MKRVILTIAIVLCAASAFADDHRYNRGAYNNGHHYGRNLKYDSFRGTEYRDERRWKSRNVVYRPEYREVRELPVRYGTYRPEYRYEQPRLAVALPLFPLSLFVAFR